MATGLWHQLWYSVVKRVQLSCVLCVCGWGGGGGGGGGGVKLP